VDAPLTVLVVHPSKLLTDHRPWGDGLMAHAFIARLAVRGHRLHVACQQVALRDPLPGDVTLHRLSGAERLGPRGRVAYARRLRALAERLGRTERIDLAHQLNPVDVGLSLGVPAGLPLVLGPYVPDWPAGSDDVARPGPRVRAGRVAADAARSAVRHAQQRRATTLLLSTPAARAKVHGPGRRAEVLPYGVDLAAFPPFPPRAGGAGEAPTVVYVGSLSVRKGVFTLVAAFERVAAALPGARLLVAGSGGRERELRARVAASPARDAIELLGHVERAAAAATLARGDVVCVPSYGEPFGLTALEAMACARPVVGTAAGGLAHLVAADGGLLVPPRDERALAGALLELLADPARRAAMGTANRRRAERDFAWDRVIDRLERRYRDARGAGAGRR
jgi:glycosyltransferase involved in cell wall biosynthesis